jgi:cysteine desulfurase
LPENRLYFDYNASAPLRPEARAAMLEAMEATGNSSSVHAEGRAAHTRIETARNAVAGLVGASAKNVTFTSGGTEGNATVLTPDWTWAGKPYRLDLLFVSATEHPSVLAGGRFPSDAIRTIPVDGDGVVDLTSLKAMLLQADREGLRALVSVMLANNETGAIQPVADVARIAHEHGAVVHTDATQAAGRIPVDILGLGVDVLTLSAHKIGGPQGAGAIVRASEELAFTPLFSGGAQENRLRAGTANTPAIAGFGAAAAAARAEVPQSGRWAAWRDELLAAMGEGVDLVVFAGNVPRLPQTLCIGVSGVPAQSLLIALDLAGVAISSGSACSSGKVGPSHVLAAMGVPPAMGKSAIRVSFGWETRAEDINRFRGIWGRTIARLTQGGNVRAA